MLPISVVSKIEEYKNNPTLIPLRERFYNLSQDYIVVDDFLLEYDKFYEALEKDEEQLDALLPAHQERYNYAEKVVLFTHMDDEFNFPDKEGILISSPENIVLAYHEFLWVKEYIDENLKKFKDLFIQECKQPVHYYFNSFQKRIPIIDEKDTFLDWYYCNFYWERPTKYNDIGECIKCASSYYDVKVLERLGGEINYKELTHPGAIWEALKEQKYEKLLSFWQKVPPSKEEIRLFLYQYLSLLINSRHRDLALVSFLRKVSLEYLDGFGEESVPLVLQLLRKRKMQLLKELGFSERDFSRPLELCFRKEFSFHHDAKSRGRSRDFLSYLKNVDKEIGDKVQERLLDEDFDL